MSGEGKIRSFRNQRKKKKENKMAWEDFDGFQSSNIALLKYEVETWTLEVTFHGGGIYHYFDVPAEIWNDLKTAESQGKYLNSNIKGHFRYAKV